MKRLKFLAASFFCIRVQHGLYLVKLLPRNQRLMGIGKDVPMLLRSLSRWIPL